MAAQCWLVLSRLACVTAEPPGLRCALKGQEALNSGSIFTRCRATGRIGEVGVLQPEGAISELESCRTCPGEKLGLVHGKE